MWLYEWARKQDIDFYSVDVEHRKREQDYSNINWVITESGSKWCKDILPGLNKTIKVLYLDNFDWIWKGMDNVGWIQDQVNLYKTYNMYMNNMNSQRAHLEQMMTALPSMAPQSIVVCDDTWYNKWWGHFSGKGGAVVPFLLNNGYEVLYTCEDPEYGTILGRGIK